MTNIFQTHDMLLGSALVASPTRLPPNCVTQNEAPLRHTFQSSYGVFEK